MKPIKPVHSEVCGLSCCAIIFVILTKYCFNVNVRHVMTSMPLRRAQTSTKAQQSSYQTLNLLDFKNMKK